MVYAQSNSTVISGWTQLCKVWTWLHQNVHYYYTEKCQLFWCSHDLEPYTDCNQALKNALQHCCHWRKTLELGKRLRDGVKHIQTLPSTWYTILNWTELKKAQMGRSTSTIMQNWAYITVTVSKKTTRVKYLPCLAQVGWYAGGLTLIIQQTLLFLSSVWTNRNVHIHLVQVIL